MNPFKRRAGGQPAPGAGNTPVPGQRAPTAAGPQSPRPAPAPGHDYGPLECVTKHWSCGCRHYFDDTMRLVAVMPCAPAGEPDACDLWYRGVCAEAEREDQ